MAHESPAHGQHLLLAAGEGARHLAAALLQPGEEAEHHLQVLGDAGVALGVGAHLQVLLHAHLQEDPPSLGDLGQAHLHDLVGRDVGKGLAQEGDGAGPAVQQARDGIQRGGFARAVGADEGDDLTLLHLEGNVLDGVDAAVVDVEVFRFQDGIHAYAPFCLPR